MLKNNYSLIYSLIYSLLFGIIIYGNYLGTNYATIKVFDEKLASVDLIKGGTIMTITRYIYIIKFNKKLKY